MYWNFGNDPFVFTIWPDAADIDSTVYQMLMLTSNSLCKQFGPVLPEGATVPDDYKMAEIIQARHTWGQLSGGNREDHGPAGMEIPVYPLVFVAQNLLRPPSSPLKRIR